MRYVIMDLEWNQPLGPSLKVHEPVELSGEIIEIGAVLLDESFAVQDTFKSYVCPKHYRKLHRRVGGLTHISPKLLAEAPTFPEAFAAFMEWCGPEFRFITWSTSDVPMLRQNLQLHGIEADLGEDAVDLQWIFMDQLTQDGRQYRLSDAVRMMHLPIDDAHDALNDCVNTARIADCLDMQIGIEDYDYYRSAPDDDGEEYPEEQGA